MAVFKPAQSSDDCRLRGTTLSLIYFDMGKDSVLENSNGTRFENVTIPKDATILSAIVTFQAEANRAGTVCNVKINGEAADDAITFSTSTDYTGRTRTTAYVDWNDIPAWTIDTDYDTPSLIDIIQEIVNRAGWVSGNHLVLFCANNVSDTNAYRSPKDYNDSTTLCARLTVTWSEPGGGAFFQLF